jgi:gentisate 1,2-dioxygenase
MYVVMEGSGTTEIAGRRFAWERNDIFVVPNFLWRRHVNTGSEDAVLYSVSDAPLMEKIGQYRVQGRSRDGAVENLVA